jgi:hypothetical protein
MMNCEYCNKPIILVPSAQERSKKYGQSPAFYTKLFTIHAQCQLDKRKFETHKLMQSLLMKTTEESQHGTIPR